MDRIALIGLGAMGAPMAANLLKAGFPVIVHNRTREREEPLAELGSERAPSPARAAADADIIITIVSDVPDVLEVICGPEGVLEGCRAGSLIIDMSTIGPAAARDIADSVQSSGSSFLDAPVSGGPPGAQAGTLSIMVGGSEQDVRRATPAFEAMGKRITHFGPVGSGQAAKLVNQVIGAINLCAVAEGLAFAETLGLEAPRVVEALSGGAATSWMLENLGPRMLSSDFDPGFKVGLQVKDLRLVLAEADRSGSAAVLTRVAKQMLDGAIALGHGDDGTQSVIDAVRSLA